MKKLFTLLLLLSVVFGKMTAQNAVKNTSVASMCGCPGEVWNLGTPYKPYVLFPQPNNSKRLMHNDYGFNIPASATITGIQVNFSYSTANTPANALSDSLAVLLLNGNLLGTDQYSATGFYNSSGNVTIGGPGNTWGTALTPADVNSPGFGFNIKFFAWAANSDLYFTNGATMTIYYSTVNGVSEAQHSSQGLRAWVSGSHLRLYAAGAEKTSIDIFNITGKKVISAAFDSKNDNSLDISSLEKGVYVYRMDCSGRLKTGKFLVD
jgi:hypothetical protein